MALTNNNLVKVSGSVVDERQEMADAGAIVTTVGNPGTDANFPTEKAVRSAVEEKAHTQGTDEGLDTGGTHAITASTIKTHVDNTTTNPHNVTKANVGLTNVTDDAQVIAPATNTADKVPQWDGADSKTLKDGLSVGTSANNLVQLDSEAKLPAVDGSQLTNLPSGFSDPMTTRGDIIIRSETGTTRLGIGTDGQVLKSDGTDIAWGEAGGAGGLDWNNVITENTTAAKDKGYLMNASINPVTLTLPASPTTGDVVGVALLDKTNTVTVARNGLKIMGQEEDLTLDVNDVSFTLIYTGATQGWKILTYLPLGSAAAWEADGDNHIAPTSGKRIKAEIADVDASGFNKNLSADDDDVQKALVTIDQMDAGGGGGVDIRMVWAMNG